MVEHLSRMRRAFTMQTSNDVRSFPAHFDPVSVVERKIFSGIKNLFEKIQAWRDSLTKTCVVLRNVIRANNVRITDTGEHILKK